MDLNYETSKPNLIEITNAIASFDDDCLADVFRPWDCYKQEWYDESTAIYRFDTNDCLVFEDGEDIGFKVSPIDTSYFEESFLKLIGAGKDEACLCWRRDENYRSLIGTNKAGIELLRFLC